MLELFLLPAPSVFESAPRRLLRMSLESVIVISSTNLYFADKITQINANYQEKLDII